MGLRSATQSDIAVIVRHLRAGKNPKEIAFLLNRSYDSVRKMLIRYQEVRAAYVETYRLRYPQKVEPPIRLRVAL